MDDLAAIHSGLNQRRRPVGNSGEYLGALVPGTDHHVASDDRGRPALLVRAEPTDVRPASILLENLRVEHGIRCSITSRQGECLKERYTVIQCCTEAPVLQRYFLDLCQVLLADLPNPPSQRDVADRVDHLSALFRALGEPSQRSVQGLWGELFIIVNSEHPAAMVRAWHCEANERYDFSVGDKRLEVKTCSTRFRTHYFSMEQLAPSPPTHCVVASLFVEPSTGGRTLGSLWDEARALVCDEADLRNRVDQVALQSLGIHWAKSREVAFDEQLAMTSLAFYAAGDLPRISDAPTGVSEVRFRSDMSSASPLAAVGTPASQLLDKWLKDGNFSSAGKAD